MSTSEFESPFEESPFDSSGLSFHEKAFPDDFSAEEMDFARELSALFAPAREEVPPLFIQTLMASDDPRFQPVEREFESKTSARVFRRLKLHRRLFQPARFSVQAVLHALPVSRSLVTLGAACMLMMLITMALTGPAFASGLNFLWAGAHSGALLVDRYPHIAPSSQHNASTTTTSAPHTQIMSLIDAQQYLKFPMFFPNYVPANYLQSDVYLYPSDQSWADGPVMVVDYADAQPGQQARELTICEFKPLGNVFQVVQNDAAQRIQIGPSGSPSAVYVEGQWTQDNGSPPAWAYSDRSELIYQDQKSGVVFWIVGDQHDGFTHDELSKIATSLSPLNLTGNLHMEGRLNQVIRSESGVPSVFADDVIYLDNPNDPGGPSFKLVGASSDPSPPPVTKGRQKPGGD